MIEPVDGFHPNQIGNYYDAGFNFKWIQEHHPDFIPKRNPHNDEIAKMFGDQGGY